MGVPNELSGGRANYFTSIGATNELFIKPDVCITLVFAAFPVSEKSRTSIFCSLGYFELPFLGNYSVLENVINLLL